MQEQKEVCQLKQRSCGKLQSSQVMWNVVFTIQVQKYCDLKVEKVCEGVPSRIP